MWSCHNVMQALQRDCWQCKPYLKAQQLKMVRIWNRQEMTCKYTDLLLSSSFLVRNTWNTWGALVQTHQLWVWCHVKYHFKHSYSSVIASLQSLCYIVTGPQSSPHCDAPHKLSLGKNDQEPCLASKKRVWHGNQLDLTLCPSVCTLLALEAECAIQSWA